MIGRIPRGAPAIATALLIGLAACDRPDVAAPRDADAYRGYRAASASFTPRDRASFTASPGANVIVNGSFEINGGLNSSNSEAGWLGFSNVPPQFGGWAVQAGTTLLNTSTVPAPTDGQFAVFSWNVQPGVQAFFQDVSVPASGGILSFDVAIENRDGGFFTPALFTPPPTANQQFRAELLDPALPATIAGPVGVLRTLYQTHSGDPLTGPYQHITSDVSAFAGQIVRLRFAVAHDRGNMEVGIDNVVLIANDVTAPVITPHVVGTLGNNGWYTSDVTVSFDVNDPESAVTSAPCTGGSVTTNTAGITFSCSATSAGGTSSQSVTVKRDATAPVVAFSGAAVGYGVDQNVSITCSASDAMSGLASSTCANIAGPAYGFAIGANTFSASATDNAGNNNAASVTFSVSLACPAVTNLVKQLVTDDKWKKKLADRMDNVCDKVAKQSPSKDEQVKNFLKELSGAQDDGAVTAANAATLARLIQLL